MELEGNIFYQTYVLNDNENDAIILSERPPYISPLYQFTH